MKYSHYLFTTLACWSFCSTAVIADEYQQSGMGQCYYDPTCCTPPNCCEMVCCDEGVLGYGPLRLSAVGVVGDGMGGNNENAIVDLFWSPGIICDRWAPYIDLKWHHLGSSNSNAANGGLGVRGLDPWNRTLGFNVFYDYRYYRNTEFNQIGFGLESLGETIDFRFNGYFPFNRRGSADVVFDDYVGGYIVEASQFWLPMTGVDAEFGWTMYNKHNIRLYGALGGYYYWDTETFTNFYKKHITGAMARLSIQWTDYLTLEVKATYDKFFQTKVQGLLELTLPFEKCFDACAWSSELCSYIFMRPVERRDVIVLHHSDILWLGNY